MFAGNSTFIRLLAQAFCGALVLMGTQASPARTITPEEVEAYFVRYSATGRSDVELTISVVIPDEFTFVKQSDDGVYRSFVSLNGIPRAFKAPNERIEELAMRWVYIHETTHGLVVPYLNPMSPSSRDSIDAMAAFGFQALANEGVADARVVIELWRKDGRAVAEEFAEHIIAFRDQAPRDTIHQTQRAVRETINVLRTNPSRVYSDQEAFRMALDIGRKSAIATGAELVVKYEGAEAAKELMGSPRVKMAIAEIGESFDRAAAAYASGRFVNNAVTIRFSSGPDQSTPKDYHVYVDNSGMVTREPVFGAEGAREKHEVIALMSGPTRAEDFLAIETVKRLGRITKDQLRDTIVVYHRFMQTFAGEDPARRAKALGIMAKTIATADHRMPLGAVYSEVNRQLMFEIGYKQ